MLSNEPFKKEGATTLNSLIKCMSADHYHHLKKALSLGRWNNHQRLSDQQKEQSMQAVLLYEHTHNIPNHQRIGYIEQACKKTIAS